MRATSLERLPVRELARKVVGVGSVGTRAWIVLLLGRDEGDPLFLQAKEAEASVLEGFAGKSGFDQEGQRVVEGQRLMQAASDIFLGWLTAEGTRRQDAGLLRPPALGRKGLGAGGADDTGAMGLYAQAVRLDAGPSPCPVGQSHSDRFLPRQG